MLFAQPANDDVCNAAMLVVDDAPALFDNTAASPELDEVVPPMGNCVVGWCDFFPVGYSVWFTFEAPANGAVEVSACHAGTGIDTQLAIWQVGDCNDFGSFTLVAANDDMPGDCDSGGNIYASTIVADALTPGATYYVQMDGFEEEAGEFEISVITGVPSSMVNFVHNSGDLALEAVDIRVDGVLIADDIAFRTCTGYLPIDAGTGLYLTINDAASIDDSAPLYSDNIDLDFMLDYVLVISGIYSDSGYDPMVPLQVSVFEGAQMNAANPNDWDLLFHQGVTDAPVMDIEVIETGNNTIVNDIAFGEFNDGGYVSFPSGSYSLDLTDANGTSLDMISCLPLGLFGPGGFAVTMVTSGFIDPTSNSNGAGYGFYLVNHFDGSFIEMFSGQCPIPTNDIPCDAIDIIVNDPPVTHDNTFATADEGEVMPPNLGLDDPEADCIFQWCDGSPVQNSVWFKFVAPATTVGITTCFDNSFDTQMAVWSVGNCGDYSSFVYLSANDDADGGCGADGSLYSSAFYVELLEIGETYYVQLDGWGGEAGSFDIQIIAEVGVSETSASLVRVFPNPADDQLTFESKGEMCQIQITDITGKTIDSFVLNNKLNYDLSSYAPGVYMVNVVSAGQSQALRIVVE